MSREDRNTAIIVILVLVVCTISLVAIVNALWRLVAPGVNTFIGVIGLNVERVTIDYNFAVPALPTSTPAVPSYDYDFAVPAATSTQVDLALTAHPDQVLQFSYASDLPSQIISSIQIPKLNINAPIFTGKNPSTALTKGWWSDAGSHWGEHGEKDIYCYRRYFPPTDTRSCWNLDKLNVEDEIFVGNDLSRHKYTVVGINTYSLQDSTPRQIVDSDEYLKLITTTPLLQNNQRLVILAKLIGID